MPDPMSLEQAREVAELCRDERETTEDALRRIAADNISQAARIKELEAELSWMRGRRWWLRIQALEDGLRFYRDAWTYQAGSDQLAQPSSELYSDEGSKARALVADDRLARVIEEVER